MMAVGETLQYFSHRLGTPRQCRAITIRVRISFGEMALPTGVEPVFQD